MRFPFCFPFLFFCLAVSSSSAQIVLQQISKEGVIIQNQSIAIDIQPLVYIKVLTDSMHNEGFLEFSIDSMKSVEDKTYLFIHQGPRYYWRAIQKRLLLITSAFLPWCRALPVLLSYSVFTPPGATVIPNL